MSGEVRRKDGPGMANTRQAGVIDRMIKLFTCLSQNLVHHGRESAATGDIVACLPEACTSQLGVP